MRLAGWGGWPAVETRAAAPGAEADWARALGAGAGIARGMGRAYGDAAVGPATWTTGRLDRMLGFDEATGTLVAEAGVTLAEVIDTFLPRGWFPAVTPGTRWVSLGGMAAADVHGKNHHRDGGFAGCVDWLEVMDGDGRVARASREDDPELFAWTLGGMGLTGVILRLALRLRRVETAFVRQRTIPAPTLEAAMAAFEAHADATYSVAWIDCLARGDALGRSLVLLGEHAEWTDLPPGLRRRPFDAPARARLRVPVDAPPGLLSGPLVRLFNEAYWQTGRRRAGERLVGWEPYFYPLDAVAGWNRLYGRRGFAQVQCVLPEARARMGLRALLAATSEAGRGSFLAVLKRMGPEGPGMSFGMPGYTLALDLPLGGGAMGLVDRLMAIAVEHGGRFYLAKDARLSAAALRRADPRAEAFRRFREARGLRRSFRSALSERLEI